jgi:prepilin-type N-terminal cleavage/methylation domain-containing protein
MKYDGFQLDIPRGGPASGWRNPSIRTAAAPAFTLIEMLVALVILVIMMGAIGEVFHLAGHSVRYGQATLSTMAQVRVIEHQISNDFHEMDTNGFLVIRQRVYAPYWDGNSVQYNPGDEVVFSGNDYVCTSPNTSKPTNNPQTLASENVDWQPLGSTEIPVWRADQVSFIANGNFQSHSGNQAGGTTNLLSSNSAMIWLGQMAVSYGSSAINPAPAPTAQDAGWPAYFPEGTSSGGTYVQPGTPPTGLTAGALTLGRVAMLLVPTAGPNGTAAAEQGNLITAIGPAATGSASYGTGSSTVYATSSRIDAIEYSAAQAIAYATSQAVVNTLGNVADNFCFRYSTVQSPGDASVAGPIAGAFRMQPILMPGVCSFAVDVGSPSPNAYGYQGNAPSVLQSLYWYGPDALVPPQNNGGPVIASDNGHSDNAVFVFTPFNKAQWPTALRITYMVTDPADQLNGPLTITQIVHLPQ